jgi:hypothetical protein
VLTFNGYTVTSFHTRTDHRADRVLLATDGEQWITSLIPQNFGPEPREWWLGHYFTQQSTAIDDFMVRASLATRERDLAARAADWLDRYREETTAFLNQAGEITDAEEHDQALRPLHEGAVALIRELAATRPELHASLTA